MRTTPSRLSPRALLRDREIEVHILGVRARLGATTQVWVWPRSRTRWAEQLRQAC
jgi:hypothetical protein